MAVDMYLKIEGIKGESQDDKHKDWIEVLSFSWGVEQTRASGAGGGGGAGKVVVHDISFSKRIDASSPVLLTQCATGRHIKMAQLEVAKKGGGGKQQPYLIIKMQDILVTSYQQDGNTDTPMETLALSFSKLEESYVPQNERGGAGTPIVGGVDALGGTAPNAG